MLRGVWLFATLRTVAHQAALSMRFSRQEYWSGLPFPSSGTLPTQGWNPPLLWLLRCRQILHLYATWEAHCTHCLIQFSQERRNYYYLCFEDGETEAQGSEVILTSLLACWFRFRTRK